RRHTSFSRDWSSDVCSSDLGPSTQTLVDAAHLAQAFLRAPKALWEPLSEVTKQRVVEEFKLLRRIKPNESNWLLFAAMTETFLYFIGEDCVREKIDYAEIGRAHV